MFHWRDGLCDCCAYGWCHPLFCLSIWFTPLALVQVMTRLNLDLCADPSTAARERKFWTNFKIMLVILIVYFIIDLALSAVITATGTQTPVLVLIKVVVRTVFGLYVLIVACKTRSSIRRRDRIPEETCVGCEDCCVAYWCTFCTVAQMARHTADYGIYGAACCTETGLVENTAPAKSLSHVV